MPIIHSSSSSPLCLVILLLVLILLLFDDCSQVIAVEAAASRKQQQQQQYTLDDYLSFGDTALSNDEIEKAISYYQKGIHLLKDDDDDNDYSLTTLVSIHTNLATALSAIGKDEEAIKSYQNALIAYKEEINDIVDKDIKQEVTDIVAQSAFYLGMVYQDLNQIQDSIDSYTYANQLDPLHWSSLANLGSILHDKLSNYRQALIAYNKAYAILTDTSQIPTDPPTEPRYILSQLQYRIGLCISHDISNKHKCVVEDDPDNPVDCKELATHAFALAVEYDPDNESAKHMLATITADSTMKRASNEYIKTLFDDYAINFEHSLVQELGYTGYERLRRGFDRAFKDNNPPMFDIVIDAGCGTGLVGEQFRNISTTLIGVDLSEAIINQAIQVRPNLYNDVLVGDMIEIFYTKQNTISLIIAADAIIYFGDLDPLFQSIYNGLIINGYVAFTLENVNIETEQTLIQSKPDWRWQLTASGRFAHRKEYVIDTGKKHGLDIIHYEPLEGFRYEHGVPVRGHLFLMQKKVMKDEL